MIATDGMFVIQWWVTFFFVGVSCIPLMLLLFPKFVDKGYIFSKVLGIILLSYLTLIFGEIHLLPFKTIDTIFLLLILAIINLLILLKNMHLLHLLKNAWKLFIAEEMLFFAGLYFWSYIRGNAPDIHGLEKYMDFGFTNSILRSTYFPPKDMWYPPFSINYYYFGHFVTAVLTKLSNIPSEFSFNLMLATLFAFTLCCSFSLGLNLVQLFLGEKAEGTQSSDAKKNAHTTMDRRNKHSKSSQYSTVKPSKFTRTWKASILTGIGAILTAYLTTFAGNLHTIYAFFKPYENENPVPFWQKPLSINLFPNSYWYPNATRFIYHTIHEFPIYSFVVSDLHGHVLDIPFVFLTIAILLSFFISYRETSSTYKLFITISVGFLLAVMYMTNAWDGIIYFLLAASVTLFLTTQNELESTKKRFLHIIVNKDFIINNAYYIAITFISFIFFSLPFSIFFKPFASQIGILCAPKFLTNIGHFGPILFEADHCQHSPLYQLAILHGFFIYWISGFILFLLFIRGKAKTYTTDYFVLLLIILSLLLIIIPEFVYLKDIYPAHYRANTMFKLVYQSFMMLSLSTGYIIVRLLTSLHGHSVGKKTSLLFTILYFPFGALLVALVAIYPYFSINSYYGNLQMYYGLDGTKYLQRQYPADYEAIKWLNQNITDQPVILEAQGDSYTDYARVSANTGLPTPLGWTVHEWLWRGSYNPLPERINDVQRLYETNDPEEAKTLIKKYMISFIFVGDLERKKYTNLNDNKFLILGKVVFHKDGTTIYQVSAK